MEKTGFIYIWYDRKRKMYYVGCHWGTIDDGYICSSNRMRDAYRRRPHDFKRRIIQTGIKQETLLEEEHKWLSLISKSELGTRYYNLHAFHFGHWSSNPRTRLSVGQKISNSPNRAKNIGLANKGRKPSDKAVDASRKKRTGKTYEELHGIEKSREIKAKLSLVGKGRKHTDEAKQKMSIKAKQVIRKPASEATKQKMSESHRRKWEERRCTND